MDPDLDPGGPKTRGSGGSGFGSATLIKTLDPELDLDLQLEQNDAPDPELDPH